MVCLCVVLDASMGAFRKQPRGNRSPGRAIVIIIGSGCEETLQTGSAAAGSPSLLGETILTLLPVLNTTT